MWFWGCRIVSTRFVFLLCLAVFSFITGVVIFGYFSWNIVYRCFVGLLSWLRCCEGRRQVAPPFGGGNVRIGEIRPLFCHGWAWPCSLLCIGVIGGL